MQNFLVISTILILQIVKFNFVIFQRKQIINLLIIKNTINNMLIDK